MTFYDIIAQTFGILGLALIAYSYQEKNNIKFLTLQGCGSLFFFVNYIMIGAVSGALFNLVNIIRSILFIKNDKNPAKLIAVEAFYVVCFA